MITDEQIIQLIETELRDQSLGGTEQYLAIHAPVLEEGRLRVDRIDRERADVIVAYLPVIDQRFYFAFYIDPQEAVLTGMGTEAWHRVYFRATSTSLSASEMQAMTRLTATSWWNKGDKRPRGRSTYQFTNFAILPNPEPDEFEDKLRKLLDHLEQDPEGIRRLVNEAGGYIQVAMDFHNGDGMLGWPTIDAHGIQRMATLGLSINFGLYVAGEPFKEE